MEVTLNFYMKTSLLFTENVHALILHTPNLKHSPTPARQSKQFFSLFISARLIGSHVGKHNCVKPSRNKKPKHHPPLLHIALTQNATQAGRENTTVIELQQCARSQIRYLIRGRRCSSSTPRITHQQFVAHTVLSGENN